jgi:hypothetical protein
MRSSKAQKQTHFIRGNAAFFTEADGVRPPIAKRNRLSSGRHRSRIEASAGTWPVKLPKQTHFIEESTAFFR